MEKYKNTALIIGILVLIVVIIVITEKLREPTFVPYSQNECAQRIFASANMYDEGRKAEKMGNYDLALDKYAEAIAVAIRPTKMNCGEYDSTSMARSGIRRVFEKQQKYEDALGKHQWFLQMNPDKKSFKDKQFELEALLNLKNSGNDELVRRHTEYLQNEYQNYLPPLNYGTYSVIVATDIMRLYDHIADQDKGIAFADRILAYPDLSKKSRQEYQKIKTAFEKDKAEGTKGRATRALIESDYFPW